VGNGGTSGSLGSGNVTDSSSLVYDRSDNVSNGSIISGAGTLTQMGTGALTLSDLNTYTGTTSVTAGTLAFGSVAANGSAQPLGEGLSAILLSNGALQYTGGTNAAALGRSITVTGGTTGTISNTGGGTLILTGGTLTKTAANLVLTGGNFVINDVITSNRITDTSFNSDMYFSTGGTVVLNAQNTYFGNTFIDTNTTVQNGISDALPTDTVLTLGENSGNTSGKLDLHSFNQTIAGLTTSGTGAANIITNNASGTGTSILTVNNDATTSNADYTFNGSIQDGSTAHVALVKTGDHTLDLTGANTYTGGTSVQAGTLQVGTGGSLASTGGVSLGNGTSSGVFTLGDGTGAVSQTVRSLTTSGTGTSNAVVGGNASSASILTINNTSTDTYSGKLGGSTATANNLALIAVGSSELSLTGNNNTYTGGTTVNNGARLAVNNTSGSGTGVGNLTVNSGGILLGSGIIAPNVSSGVTITSGGELNPGADPVGPTANGFITLTSAVGATTPVLTLATPASVSTPAELQFDLGTGVNGITSLGANVGDVNLAGSSAYIELTTNAVGEVVFSNNPAQPTLLNLDILTSAVSQGNYLLFAGGLNTDYANLTIGSGGMIVGGLALDLPASYPTSFLFEQGGDIYVHVVPEPSTWAMLIMGLAMLVLGAYYRRSRRVEVVSKD
jgi:fibronectin-binding autotransporter adhesin